MSILPLDPVVHRSLSRRGDTVKVLKGVVQSTATGGSTGTTAVVTIGEVTYPSMPVVGTVVVGQVVFCVSYQQGRLLIFGSASGSTTVQKCQLRLAAVSTAFLDKTFTAVSWSTADVVSNASGWWSSANPSVVTVPATGTYLISFATNWATNSTGTRFSRLVQNGASLLTTNIVDAVVDSFGRASTAVVVNAAANDYFSVEGWQSSGVSISMGTVTQINVLKLG